MMDGVLEQLRLGLIESLTEAGLEIPETATLHHPMLGEVVIVLHD